MSQQTVRSGVGERTTADYLKLIGLVLYGLAGLAFLLGLWFDWQAPGQIIIPPFALADEPNANSGLFILSVLLLAAGYVVSKVGYYLVERSIEETDQTQEWTVDVGSDN